MRGPIVHETYPVDAHAVVAGGQQFARRGRAIHPRDALSRGRAAASR